MKKQTTKFTKQQKEKIENKLLAIFATALGAVMILMYLMNWFQGSIGFLTTARVLTYVFMVGFIGLAVFLKIKSKAFKKQEQTERALKYNNWFWVSVTGFIVAFFTYPTEIISQLFGLVRLQNVGMTIVTFINKFNHITGNPITTRIVLVMILIGVYTVATFIYYGIQTRIAHKASLNKGAKKSA